MEKETIITVGREDLRRVKATPGKEFYERYFDGTPFVGMYWDVGAWCTRKAVREKISHAEGLVLELGTGLGTSLMDLQGFTAIGLDYAEQTLRQASRYLGRSVPLVNADAQRLPFKDNTFDVVISQHCLEHIADDQGVADELYRVLKPGGECILLMPGSLDGRATPEEETTMGHLRSYNAQMVQALFRSHPQFKVVEISFIHRAHTLIWNRLKYLLRGPDWVIEKLFRVPGFKNRMYERPVYRKMLLPFFVWLLDGIDRLVSHKEQLIPGVPLGTKYNVLLKGVKLSK